MQNMQELEVETKTTDVKVVSTKKSISEMLKDSHVDLFSYQNIVFNMIKATNGRFFKVKFTTKNGELREKTVRVGVTKGLVGGINTTEHLSHYIKLFVVGERKYNNVNINNILGIKCGEMVWEAGGNV